MYLIKIIKYILIAVVLFHPAFSKARAAVVEYHLEIAERKINITGKQATAMTINGTVPGPVLRFREGDIARIHVHNKMNADTSIHWHGILLPPEMDGVPYISFQPIKPGAVFTYEFKVRQSGTYWYHSHTELQEQSGVYGTLIFEPATDGNKPDRDYVVFLSDWTDEDPHTVNRTLKMGGGEWYAIQKGNSQSIAGAARAGKIGDYFKRELQRMPPMDISDIAYDAFLANGEPETALEAMPGETVKLRVVNGSAATYFYVEYAGGPMTIVAADGPDVAPVKTGRFLIAIAETYDILVTVPGAGAYEFRATPQDGSGYASVWIGSGKRHLAPEVPHSNLYHAMGGTGIKQVFALTPAGAMGMPDGDVKAGKFDKPGMAGMELMEGHGRHEMPGMEMNGGAEQNMPEDVHKMHDMNGMNNMNDHKGHGAHHAETMQHIEKEDNNENEYNTKHSGKKYTYDFRLFASDVSNSKNLAPGPDGMDPSRPWPPYPKLKSLKNTALKPGKPVREIRLTLDGDMERFVWFINNKPLLETDSIRIRAGEAVRFIMINRTMMHHPMHLHGHVFRVVNGQGDHAPLKHTVDVSPMSTTVIEFDADETGDWFFHCHILYHMENGMARLIHYKEYSLNPELSAIRPELYKEHRYFFGRADALSNMTEGFLMLSDTRNNLTAEWEVGWQNSENTDWEYTFTWDRYFNSFTSVFAGAFADGTGNESEDIFAVLGARYLLPFNFESMFWIDSRVGARITLGKHFVIFPRLTLYGDAEYDIETLWEGRAGLSYLINKNFSIIAQWHSDFGFGAGLQLRF